MISFKTIILTFLVLASCGCGTNAPDHMKAADAPREVAAALDVTTDESLYALGSAWTDQEGTEIRLPDLQGRRIMMSMVFTNCHYACPIIVHDMKRIKQDLPQDVAADLHFVLVSLDPERDDPEALARFARAYGLDADQWTLLQGNPNDVRMLATALGVKYKKEADGQYSHTNMVAVLDERGEILHREMNPGGESTSLIAAVRRSAFSPSL